MKFKLSLPPTLNATYKIGRYKNLYKSRHVKDWETEAGWTLKKAMKGKKIIEEKCWVHIKFCITHPRDIDGSIKLVLDVMQGFVYINDRQVKRLIVDIVKVKSNKRVELEVGEKK